MIERHDQIRSIVDGYLNNETTDRQAGKAFKKAERILEIYGGKPTVVEGADHLVVVTPPIEVQNIELVLAGVVKGDIKFVEIGARFTDNDHAEGFSIIWGIGRETKNIPLFLKDVMAGKRYLKAINRALKERAAKE